MNPGLEFFTATCLNWQHLLEREKHKEIVLDSLKFLVPLAGASMLLVPFYSPIISIVFSSFFGSIKYVNKEYELQARTSGGLLLNKINSIAPANWWQYGIK